MTTLQIAWSVVRWRDVWRYAIPALLLFWLAFDWATGGRITPWTAALLAAASGLEFISTWMGALAERLSPTQCR